jgi:hypothetical protein
MLGQNNYELLVKITGDASNFKSELEKAGGGIANFMDKVGNIGKTMTIVGSAIIGPLTAIVKKTADAGDQFKDMSVRTGIAVETLSSLSYACNITGTSIEGFETGLKFLTRGINDASMGIGEAKEAFEELEIATTDSEGNLRGTVEVLKEAATKIAAIENPTKQAALAMELFGSRSGTQLVPLLKLGGQGIDELMQKAEDLNIVISDQAATAADIFNDGMEGLTSSIASAGRTIGDVLIPALIPLLEKITDIIVKVTKWAEENPKLVETIVKVGAVIGAIAVVGGPILMAAAAFSALLSPIGLVIAAITALIAAVAGFVIAWKNDWGGIKTWTLDLVETIKSYFTGLVDYIGNIMNRITDIISGVINKAKSIGQSIAKFFGGGQGEPETVTATGQQVSLEKIPIHQHGIDYVPKTGLALIHEGEAVLNKIDAESYRKGNMGMSYNPSISITIQGDGDESKIRRAVEQALNESARQFRRTGYELIPGMG